MAWTAADLTAVEDAIRALMTGAKSYAINGRSVTKADLGELRAFRSEIQAEQSSRRTFQPARLSDVG